MIKHVYKSNFSSEIPHCLYGKLFSHRWCTGISSWCANSSRKTLLVGQLQPLGHLQYMTTFEEVLLNLRLVSPWDVTIPPLKFSTAEDGIAGLAIKLWNWHIIYRSENNMLWWLVADHLELACNFVFLWNVTKNYPSKFDRK